MRRVGIALRCAAMLPQPHAVAGSSQPSLADSSQPAPATRQRRFSALSASPGADSLLSPKPSRLRRAYHPRSRGLVLHRSLSLSVSWPLLLPSLTTAIASSALCSLSSSSFAHSSLLSLSRASCRDCCSPPLPGRDCCSSRDSMGSKFETVEARIKSLLAQLQFECGILQRMIHKNKNQHRRAPYFQHLLKVKRNLMLLQSANLEELVTSSFLVIKGERPKQKVHLLESLKRRKCEYGKYNFMERLLGAAHLLAEMVEPILKAATQISVLFAQEFFMGFAMVNMALLARLRVLVQQILLDVVSLFNMVSSLSRKKQSIKITHEGIEVFREFYPVTEDFVKLECVWKSDKFILVERKHEGESENQDEDTDGNVLVGASAVNYDSVEVFLGDDQLLPNNVVADSAAKEDPSQVTDMNTDILIEPSQIDNGKNTDCGVEGGENQGNIKASCKESSSDASLHALSQSSPNAKPHSGSKKVAFLSIKNHTPPSQSVLSLFPLTNNIKALENESDPTKDNTGNSLASLLTDVNAKDSLF